MTPAEQAGYIEWDRREPEDFMPAPIPRLIFSEVLKDSRGLLRVWGDLPFPAVRAFSIKDVPKDQIRGGHAHATGSQMIVCVSGKFVFSGAHSTGSYHWCLSQGISVFVPPLTWIVLEKFTARAEALVFCSEPYTPPITTFETLQKLWKNDSVY